MIKLTKNSLVTLVELPPTQFGEFNGDLSFDVFNRSNLPARGIHQIQAVLQTDGWINIQTINPLYHGKDGKLTQTSLDRIASSAVLGISSITRTAKQSMALAKLYKQQNPDGIVIAGGPDPTFRDRLWLEQGNTDIIVKREGDKTIVNLMNRLMQDRYALSDIPGISYRNQMEIEQPAFRASLLTPEDLAQLPHPYYDELTQKGRNRGLNTAVQETTRGCPNACDFCSVSQFYGGTYRPKPIDYILEGLRRIRHIGKFLFFTDDNLIGMPEKTKSLLKAIVNEKLARPSCAQATVTLGEDSELLEDAKKAGLEVFYIGIESIVDKTLDSLGKPYTAQQNRDNIKRIRNAGFWVHGMMMPGGDGDDKEKLRETLEWAKENLDSVQFMPPTPLPGTVLHAKMKREGRILTDEAHLYDVQHVVTRPLNFSPFELQTIINDMYKEFYSIKETFKRTFNAKGRRRQINIGINVYLASSNAIARTLYGPQEKAHLEFLKKLQ